MTSDGAERPVSPALKVRGVFLPDEVDREAWVLGGKLTFERPRCETDTVVAAGWLLPGFVDAHCHVGFSPEGHVPDAAGQEAQVLLHRDAGALLLRDAGSPVDNSSVQRSDDLPELIRAGRHIARTGRYVRHLGVEVEPEDLAHEVGVQALRGNGWVKLAADWIDRALGDLAPVWPDDVLAEAIALAHSLGVRVAAHTFGEDALPGLINAGVDSIEHGTGLTADVISDVVARGIAVVPTLMNIDTFPEIAARGQDKFPIYAAHMRALHATRHERVRNLWEAGAQLYVGTDAGGTLAHGQVRKEISRLVEVGIPQAEVIAQASWRARAWLGRPGLVEGAPANFVVYSSDPRTDLSTIYQPQRIVLRGVVVQ